MAAGKVDLEVRYLDVESGRGIALDQISGVVKNARGEVVETVVPDPASDADGVYYVVSDYDVARQEFAGLFLTVDWSAVRFGTVLPLCTKRYDYRPVSRAQGYVNIVTWEPICTNAIFYEITREKDNVEEFVGRSFTNMFIDRTVFANEMEANSYKYFAYPAEAKPGTSQPDGSNYEVSQSRINATVQRAPGPVCLLSGRIIDVFGRSAHLTFEDATYEHEIAFCINPRDYHTIVRDLYIVPEDVYAPLNDAGEFYAPLLQDLVVEMRVPHNRFRGRFVVPRLDNATLEDLDIEILRDY